MILKNLSPARKNRWVNFQKVPKKQTLRYNLKKIHFWFSSIGHTLQWSWQRKQSGKIQAHFNLATTIKNSCSMRNKNVPYLQCPKTILLLARSWRPNCLSLYLKHVHIHINIHIYCVHICIHNMQIISHHAVYLSPWSQTSCNEPRQTIKSADIKVRMLKKSLLWCKIK